MDSYRVEKKAAVKIQLTDQDAEIASVPTSRGGGKLEPELDRLSNILKTFNDQFGNIPWTDSDRVHKLITEDIPERVAADIAYQNGKKNSDTQNARIEHDKALASVIVGVMKDDTELFKACRRSRCPSLFSQMLTRANLQFNPAQVTRSAFGPFNRA